MNSKNYEAMLYAEALILFKLLGNESTMAALTGNYQRERRLHDLCDRALFRLLRRQRILMLHEQPQSARAA
jgi:hypothetical protein